jgi:hypothetical protein
LRKDQAQAMYRICQQHDQVWREKRRIRELEELRAKSGGVQFGGRRAGRQPLQLWRRRGLRADGAAPNRNRPAACARRAKCSMPNSSATLNSRIREVAVAQPVERIGPLPQRAEQLARSPKALVTCSACRARV